MTHLTLDTESVISILENTFKNRPDESQGGLIEENVQSLSLSVCPNVDVAAIKQHLANNQGSYVVEICLSGEEYLNLLIPTSMQGDANESRRFVDCVYVLSVY